MNDLKRTAIATAKAFQQMGIESRPLREYLTDCVDQSQQFIDVSGDSLDVCSRLTLENQMSNCRILIAILRVHELTSDDD